MAIIAAQNLGKAYRRYPSNRHRLVEWLSFGRAVRHEDVWVLKDVSFAIDAGESVGIVGANGAGKSTLLKIMTGTTLATTGRIDVGGRVAAILELGMGFHWEFSGRENAMMAGQLTGIDAAAMRELLPEVEAFAEIGDYFDMPLRTYSSGMVVRLAFSVATARRPDILIVDEALSVGDAYFEHKCIDRIRRFRNEGTTLVFVSHAAGTVKTLCTRALLLDRGHLIRDGAPDSVLDYYNAIIARREVEYQIEQAASHRDPDARSTRSGSGKAKIAEVELFQSGAPARALVSGKEARIRVRIASVQPIHGLTVGILIRDALGNDIFGTNTEHLGVPAPSLDAGAAVECEFDLRKLALGAGRYSLTVALHRGDSHLLDNYDWWDRALVFEVVPGSGPKFIGSSAIECNATFAAPVEGAKMISHVPLSQDTMGTH
jgi:homopolymeric O-antigen transport system ATP-binding protein